MTLLNEADVVRLGNQTVSAVYAGATKIWPVGDVEPPAETYTIFDSMVGYQVDNQPTALRVGMIFYIESPSTYTANGIRIFIAENPGFALTGCWGMLYGYKPQQLMAVKPFAPLVVGWNEVLFDEPVPLVNADDRYFGAVVYMPSGGYSYLHDFFNVHAATSDTLPALTAASAGEANGAGISVDGNGFFKEGALTDPTDPVNNPAFWESFNSTHYGTDVIVAGPVQLSLAQEITADGPTAWWRGPFPSPGVVGSQLPDAVGTAPTMALDLWNASPGTSLYPKDAASSIPSDPTGPALDLVPDSNLWRANPPSYFKVGDYNGTLSISLWAKPRVMSGATWHDVVRKGNEYGITLESVGGKNVWSAIVSRNGAPIRVYGPEVVPGKLVHVGMSYDKIKLALYIDGVEVANVVGAEFPAQSSFQNFVIGQFGAVANAYDGLLAEVAFFIYPMTAARFAAQYKAGIAYSTLQQAVMMDAPFAYYRLNDLTDSSGGGRALTYTTPTHTVPAASIIPSDNIDGAQRFGGFAALGVVGDVDLASPHMSFEAWGIRTDSGWGGLASKGGHKMFVRSNGKFVTQWVVDGAPTWVDSNATLQQNTLYHVVGTYDGVTVKLYINGVLDASNAISGSLTANPGSSTDIRVGADENTNLWTGPMDEVAFYTYALSAERVAAHYHAGIGS